jgi:hypothetical protein
MVDALLEARGARGFTPMSPTTSVDAIDEHTEEGTVKRRRPC